MELSKWKQADTYELTLTPPGGEPLDAVFVIAGPSHPARLEWERGQFARVLRDYNKRGRHVAPSDPAEIEALQTEKLVAFTVGWRNVQFDGVALDCTPANARKIYADPALGWIRDAVNTAAGELENFLRPSSPA